MVQTLLAALCLLSDLPRPVAPLTPPRTDYELFLEQILEAPRGQRKVWNGKVYNAPYKALPGAQSNGGCPDGVCPLVPRTPLK